MVDFNDIALFVQVVRCGSFSEAGRRLGMPPNTVSRRIQALEDQLGARLMQRSTRRLTLSDAGREFHDRCAAAIDGLQQASQDLTAGSRVPSGLVRVTAPANFLDFYTPQLAAAFLGTYPQVRLEFLLDDAIVDLITDRIDVAFRGGSGGGSGYLAHRVPVSPTGLFASPDYLERHGSPQALAELASHQCLTTPRQSDYAVWRLQAPENSEEHVEVTGTFAANNTRALLLAAVAGLGIALLPGAIAAADVAAGRLVPILPQYKRRDQSMWVVYPSHRQVSPAVKAFVTSVIKRFEEEMVLLD
ncbi:LysR family transcriptional regulator [Bradyrhizobium uaiense]|uniref:LysR family transcriptional regulator n=1 Tax=Bradyrhizobium uaiense TaxID=2594946 RepID=A0A6P1B8C2_9BRAD|nr:LysR family transcriptional regulator [Bradyrhizobium uaiense]NEU94679.1 LysR family transcriptional regulator [Bradyrhizobium uaiense]